MVKAAVPYFIDVSVSPTFVPAEIDASRLVSTAWKGVQVTRPETPKRWRRNKKAQEAAEVIQKQMNDAQVKLDSLEVEGASGGVEPRADLLEVLAAQGITLSTLGIGTYLGALFPGFEVLSYHAFRLTRYSDLEIPDAEEPEDLLATIEEHADTTGAEGVVRLELPKGQWYIHAIETLPVQVGYDAGNVKGSDKAYRKLPKCCKYRDNKCEE